MPQASTGIGRIDARYEHKFMKNVVDYGATGDGTTDDTAAVEAARAACSQNDILLIPRGRFYLSDTVTISNNLRVVGVGPGSQIFMSADKDLFDVTGTGFVSFENLRLGSAATTAGKCLIKLNSNVSHYILDNVWMIGGYYGIGIYGAMFGTLKDIMSTTSFYRGGTSANQAWIHGERAGGHSVNGTTIIAPRFQGGVRGIEIADTSGEGSLEIIGGLIEAQTNAGIYLSGIGLGADIRGIHFEGTNAIINLATCKNVSIGGPFPGGGLGVTLTSCRRVRVGECYAWKINADSASWMIDVENVTYASEADGGGLDISSQVTRLRNLENTGNAAVGGYGYYNGPRGANILTNGDLETWAGGVPSGFSKTGTVTQEATTVHRGSSAARVASPGTLRYTLDAGQFKGGVKPVTISAWCYKPSSGGVNPRVSLVCNYGTTPSPSFSISAATWTRITVTFYINGSSIISGYVQFTGSGSGDIIFDDVNVSEEMY